MTTTDSSLEAFRQELTEWLQANCPASVLKGAEAQPTEAERNAWLEAFAGRGYTTPTWPKEYGGGGLSKEETKVLHQEVTRTASYMPVVSFFGTAMLGPVLLEFANEEQKHEHLPKITRGEINWCQGYSEPGSGSDLAS